MIQVPRNTAITIPITLFELDGITPYAGADPVSGDVKVYKDDGAPANITTLPTRETNVFHLELSATELDADFIVVHLIDQSDPQEWLPDVYAFSTVTTAWQIIRTSLSELSTNPGTTTTLEKMIQANYQDTFFKKDQGSGLLRRYKSDDSTVWSSQSISEASGTTTLAKAS